MSPTKVVLIASSGLHCFGVVNTQIEFSRLKLAIIKILEVIFLEECRLK